MYVGRRSKDPIAIVAQDYGQRIKHYAKLEWVVLREGRPSEEEQRFLNALSKDDYIVALDERGQHFDSIQWSRKLEDWQRDGHRKVTYLIGGADGLSTKIKDKAHERIALSKMTLPHRMALAILAEQIYRAHTIIKGEPYHRS
jgi:23S rRNA (pseudouridine1915-N3)-methyltransferase